MSDELREAEEYLRGVDGPTFHSINGKRHINEREYKAAMVLALAYKKMKSQLPDGMKECTILFKECEKGHGRLTAANWVQGGCHVCEIEQLRAANAKLVEMVKACVENIREREKTSKPTSSGKTKPPRS